jgi:Tol biopolymer transport system component
VNHQPGANAGWTFHRAAILAFSLALLSVTALLLPQRAHVSDQAKPSPLTVYLGHETSPAVSPDGTQVAFSWQPPGEDRDIYILRLPEKGTPRRLTRTSDHDDSPAWSPDGRQIAFVRNSGENGAIFIIDSSGGSERKVIATTGLAVAWARDNSSLVYDDVVPEKAISGLFKLSTVTGTRQQLTSPTAEPGHGDFWPVVSPDGKTVAFSRRLTYNDSDVYIVPIGGGAPRRISSDRRQIHGLTWTPDGD